MKHQLNCPHCGQHAVRNGRKKNNLQNYKCVGCERQFTAKTGTVFARMRFEPRIISNSLLLKFKARQSLREIKYLIKQFWLTDVSHVAIYKWVMKFVRVFEKIAKCHKIPYGNVWHVDEKYIRVKGSKDRHAYLWVVEDDKSNIITTYVSNSRDIISAKKVLRLAYEAAGFAPDVLVTDGLQAYKRACRIFGRRCKHVIAHFKAELIIWKDHTYWLSNNRIERLNSTIDMFKHVCRGFKSFATANIWFQMFAIFYTYLRPNQKYRNLTPAEAQEVCSISWQAMPARI